MPTGSISSPGIASGLDVNGIVSKLMELERRPLNSLTTKEANYNAKLTAYGSIKGALSSLQVAAAPQRLRVRLARIRLRAELQL